MTDQTAYLNLVLEKLKERIAKLNLSLEEGAKEVEDMHEYYWENYTEMDQYGYEDYDNQQALFRQMNANEEQFRLRKRFKRCRTRHSSAEWISGMTEMRRQRPFISESAISPRVQEAFRLCMTGEHR